MVLKPALVILAAGMGSRYGGMKQIDPVDPYGNLIIDYSIYDALKAGFQKIVFIIKESLKNDFHEVIGDRISKFAEVEYVYQELNKLPAGFSVPEGRIKPWGTGHALLCCKDVVKEPFAVINADDYYGRDAFFTMYDFLTAPRKSGEYAMVGYAVENTLTDHGVVVRGVCEESRDGSLLRIQEIRGIAPHQGGGIYELNGTTHLLPPGTTVSMNLWGLDPSIFEALSSGFPPFLEQGLLNNPKTCEYLLPEVVQKMLQKKEATVRVLKSRSQWFGVTYQEDMPAVQKAVQELKAAGEYKEALWS